MVFGDGYAAPLDVTAHEVTHAITERSAGLVYEGESGALNESISDIFGSNLDPDDWEIGEDLPDGAIRDMAHPERFDDPGHVDDYVDTDNDHGGVHTNSGIPNRAYVNMVESIGRDASQHIVYDAVTQHLDADSGFEDFRTACLQSAEDRYGKDSPSTAASTPPSGRRARRHLGRAVLAAVGVDDVGERVRELLDLLRLLSVLPLHFAAVVADRVHEGVGAGRGLVDLDRAEVGLVGQLRDALELA